MIKEQIQFYATIGTVLVSVVAILFSYFFNTKLLKQKKYEDEKKQILESLFYLYGPIKQYLNKSRDLYIRFRSDKPEDFRTILAIANGIEFSQNDKILLEEIIAIGTKIEDLIITKAGLIDDIKLREDYYPKFLSHTTLLRHLYNGSIKGEPDRFKDDLFPRGIEDETERRINELYQKLEVLNKLS